MARDVKEKLFEIESKKIELDFLCQQFLIECKRFAAQSIEGKVRSAISLNHEKALSLGEAGLKPIKNEVVHMMETVSDSVNAIIKNPSLWVHEIETLVGENFPQDRYLVNGCQGPEILESELKKILTPVGNLLMDHGLDTDKNWDRRAEGYVYRHGLDWSREMCLCIGKYNDRANELSALVHEYVSLTLKSSGNDALDLWDRI
jgi:hypothetical protein